MDLHRFWRERAWVLLLCPFLVLLAAAFVLPVVRILSRAFLEPVPGFGQIEAVINHPLYRQVFFTTLRISILVTATSLVLGYPVAYVAARSGPIVRSVIFSLVLVPFWTSLLVRVYGWTVILQRTGIINEVLQRLEITSGPLKLLYTEGAVVLGIAHYMIPFTVFAIYVSLQSIDPNLMTAAMTMGARPFRVFVKITLPLTMPGVIAGGLLVFITSIGFFVTPALMGSPREMMIANLITFQAKDALDWPKAAAIAVVLLFGVIPLLWPYFRVTARALDQRGRSA